MEHLKIATPEELSKLTNIDYDPSCCTGLKLGGSLAVLRRFIDLDPVIFAPESTTAQRARFIYAIEERMLGAGINGYYFNVLADDSMSEWRETVKKWGAEQVSTGPSLRFKKVLLDAKDV